MSSVSRGGTTASVNGPRKRPMPAVFVIATGLHPAICAVLWSTILRDARDADV
jgi:hypothetical protein